MNSFLSLQFLAGNSLEYSILLNEILWLMILQNLTVTWILEAINNYYKVILVEGHFMFKVMLEMRNAG